MRDHYYIPVSLRLGIGVMIALGVCFHLANSYTSENMIKPFIEEIDQKQMKEEVAGGNAILQEKSVPMVFDPNTADRLTLATTGLSNYAIDNLIKLRATGWRAESAQDLERVYGIEKEDVERFSEYVLISNGRSQKKPTPDKQQLESEKPKVELFQFDPNVVSLSELKQLGFSSHVALNLIKYRDAGAQFIEPNDLQSVYGLEEEFFTKIKPFIKIQNVVKDAVGDDVVEKAEQPQLNSFDPNTSDYYELIDLGFSPYAAKSLINYINSGARIDRVEDLKQVYGVHDDFFKIIEPYISIDTAALNINNDSTKGDSMSNSMPVVIQVRDLNSISQEELLAIPGIGKYYAKAITEYRQRLGGFVSVDQLLEVPAFREEHYQDLEPYFKIESKIKRLIAPQLEFKDLMRHPYVDFKIAQRLRNISIYDYEEDLQLMIEEEKFESRLIPYIRKQ